MKKLFLVMAAGLLLASCSKKEGLTTVQPQELTPVHVRVDDFTITVDTIPNRDGIPGYNGVKAVTLAFYTDNGTEQYKVTQLRSDPTTYTTFGEFDLSLPMGSYTMVVLGYALYDDDELTLTSPTQAEYTVGCVRETFAATQVVNINNTNGVSLSAALDRVVAKLQVVSTDGKTANASKVRMTFSAGSKRFSPTTGLATLNTGSVSIVSIGAAVGSTSSSIGYVFLATDEQTMTITIDVLDADGQSISHKVVNNVPFQRNRNTKLTGSLYTAGTNGSFTINTTWLEGDYEVNF